MGQLYAGTSGFSYAEWRGHFYPHDLKSEQMLGYYAQRLPAVELNNSFYRTPPSETLQRWAESVPDGFRFCLKAHRAVTYASAMFDRPGLAAELSSRLQPLGDRCGPVLIQFPPVRQADPGLLADILRSLARPAAVEFRHESWFIDEVFAVLGERGAALVVTDQEKWPRAPVVNLAPFAYFRLRRDYVEAALDEWAQVLSSELDSGRDVYAFFKHEAEGPERAVRLVTSSSGRRSR
jgi:uncharacterized protein YecE (DUF72 family)